MFDFIPDVVFLFVFGLILLIKAVTGSLMRQPALQNALSSPSFLSARP
jgi:hypothetical protein